MKKSAILPARLSHGGWREEASAHFSCWCQTKEEDDGGDVKFQSASARHSSRGGKFEMNNILEICCFSKYAIKSVTIW